MLVGRDAEQRGLDALLQSARDERSAVLVIRGEAGIGKTALLDYAAERATGMRVLRCVGVEAEHELPSRASISSCGPAWTSSTGCRRRRPRRSTARSG